MSLRNADISGNQPVSLNREPDPAKEQILLSKLREILLKDDRGNIADIQDLISDQEKFSEVVSPIVEFHIETMKRKFPKEYKREVETIIERKIKASQDDLMNVVYPVMGKMVRKYVTMQLATIRENVDKRVSSFFSFKGIFGRLRSVIFGVKESDIALGDLEKAIIEEIYVVQRDSGVLLGHYSPTEMLDRDMVAGMLTAIKSFVEDAFRREQQDLEMIEYGMHKIYIQSFPLYYVSVVLSGPLSEKEKVGLSSRVLDFAEKEMNRFTAKDFEYWDESEISEKLVEHFGED